jgi:parallel beta-helix repeat protein
VSPLNPRGRVLATLLVFFSSFTASCADSGAPDGLDIEVSFANDVDRSVRDRAQRVEVYLVASCDAMQIPERPSDALGSTFSVREGSEGLPIEVPEDGEYALYAIAQDQDCAVVAAGCDVLSIPDGPATVTMRAFSGPGCSGGDRCALETGQCSEECVDLDEDGVCAPDDCDDRKPNCADDCTDLDDDGFCVDTDCDDSVWTCTVDCTTNSDRDAQVDCFEEFCGTKPDDDGSECLEVGSELDYKNAINAANARAGRDYIVLDNFTMTSSAPSLQDDAGVRIRQLAGASLTVRSGSNLVVFELNSDWNWIDGIRVINASNAETVISIKGDRNIVSNTEIRGFERRGIYVDAGDDAWIFDNIVTGGTHAQGNETAGIVLKDSARTLIAGNTVALNAMDGIQVRKAVAPTIDHNTMADNGGSGLEFYGDPSSGVCIRNNNVTGNGWFGLHATETILFDESPICTGPLSPALAYGNNAFGNLVDACGGASCLLCACLPAPSFWDFDLDPSYRSVTPGDPELYCLGRSSGLIDAASELSYDLNGPAVPGNFNGTGPDVGAREDGPGDCR